jgi:hypothetical protein
MNDGSFTYRFQSSQSREVPMKNLCSEERIITNNQVIHLICKDSRYHFQITAVSDHNLPSVRKGLNAIFGYNKEIT